MLLVRGEGCLRIDGAGRLVMTSQSEKHICITRGGQESYAITELSELLGCRLASGQAECTPVTRGAVEISNVPLQALFNYPLFFACQILPSALEIHAPSIRLWAQAVTDLLLENLEVLKKPWTLDIFEPSCAETGKQYSRQRLIQDEVLTLLKKRHRSLLKSLVQEPPPEAALVQICAISNERGFFSLADAAMRHSLASSLVPYQAGYVDIPDDKAPPSRAFKKLLEAKKTFNLSFKRGSNCVDLGASPGGWSYVLMKEGCRITAVDRSPLESSLMRSKQIKFIKGDALSWEPKDRMDWLVCDVITTPDKTAALLTRWLEKSLCRRFCVTVKFKGSPDFASLRTLRDLLTQYCQLWDGKQLTANKNEVTVVGELK